MDRELGIIKRISNKLGFVSAGATQIGAQYSKREMINQRNNLKQF